MNSKVLIVCIIIIFGVSSCLKSIEKQKMSLELKQADKQGFSVVNLNNGNDKIILDTLFTGYSFEVPPTDTLNNKQLFHLKCFSNKEFGYLIYLNKTKYRIIRYDGRLFKYSNSRYYNTIETNSFFTSNMYELNEQQSRLVNTFKMYSKEDSDKIYIYKDDKLLETFPKEQLYGKGVLAIWKEFSRMHNVL